MFRGLNRFRDRFRTRREVRPSLVEPTRPVLDYEAPQRSEDEEVDEADPGGWWAPLFAFIAYLVFEPILIIALVFFLLWLGFR